ncbi:MAG: 2-hydroxyacyl-CoA dehydratase family protein [Lachnospiraceae bacterium]|nr:2-hydroxyacyl-CoA dehydratase family protein [Lachnospiraceae bacterium]MDD6182400.1 2-hydroxyacyl-CoA dehydratase family protein [Lachnospiraceae bacterium]MDD7379152.1 2-hydroxyacyl-CoA dehydratase family protein [Lachnospiraceae bacterium]MDY4617134.1 2-hydroxyacyl-CoA dehydratase family protein [Lachnospiraceae bacterium]
MGKAVGSERLGDLYNGTKVRKRREWRGFKDTWYDYTRWLKIMGVLLKFMAKPRNVKAFFRYRWMLNYLAVPMMIDKHTVGLRGNHLRIAHEEYDLVAEDIAKMLDNIFRADRNIGNDVEFSKKIVLLDENEMSQIMCGFPNLIGLSWEIPSVYVSVLLQGDAVTHYLDVVQEFGMPGDVCPMPAAEAGVCIDDDIPIFGACAVQCNTTCDGSLMGNGIISRRLESEGIPCFQLATPLRHTEEGVQEYAAQEIRNAIKFIEEHTGEKWDWDAYFTCAKRFNAETRERIEWMEMSRTDYPQVFGANLALYAETTYMAIGGKVPAFVEADRKITKLALESYNRKEMLVPEYRHRAIIWGVQAQYYTDFLPWLQNCWGILPLVDMLSLVSMEMISEDDPEQAIYDMAHLYENMIMRNRTHGGYEVLLDDLWRFCEYFRADMVILWEHMSCKALDGMHGMFEQQAREHGIKLIWVGHDLMDPRVVPRANTRDDVNRYMRSVLREEPLDPSLEEVDDAISW